MCETTEKELDARGMLGPEAAKRTKTEIERRQVGETVIVTADEP